MYPYLKHKLVIVEGPEADGLYDLNVGRFQRISKSAGDLLRSLNGFRDIQSCDVAERDFLAECDKAGYVCWQELPQAQIRTELEEVIQKIRPVRFAWIELTSKCNQLCKHCFLGEDLNAFPHYPKTEIFQMLATLHTAGARQIIFSGGEPTAHPEFREILLHAGTEYPFKMSLLTNGSHGRLLGAIELLQKYDVTVKIPILGWQESHNAMSGIHGGFERTLEAIDALVKGGVTVELGTTVTGLNFRDIPRIRDYAEAVGLPLEVSPLYAIGYAETNKSELYSISQDEIIDICRSSNKKESLVQLSVQGPSPNRGIDAGHQRYEIDPTDYDSVNLKDFLTAHHECGQKIVAILSNREVTPCLMLRDKRHSLGSLTEFSLAEILAHTTPAAISFDELMSLANVPGCEKCEARFICKAGGCPASAKAFAGSVQAKNPLFTQCYYMNSETRAEVGLAPLQA
jgi:radical SAM protein with 4Fe4S-binding SPASM domain